MLVDSDGVTFSATTDAAGAYSIGNLHPGTYSITVTADGFAPAQSTATLAAGSTLSAPNIVLATAAQVSVTVTSKTSAAVASAQVQLLQNGADWQPAVPIRPARLRFPAWPRGLISSLSTRAAF